MKGTTNAFQEGLRMDLHPLSTNQKQLTDALNATLVTFNGNEMMLQNDMGNTLIQDSATGNIMGLSPGFIPVGLKEHGGIMYIASVNKEGEGEIGTIPSPIIRNFYKGKTSKYINLPIPTVPSKPLEISYKMYPADKFIMNLRMTGTRSDFSKKGLVQSVAKFPFDDSPSVFDPNDYVISRYVLKSNWHAGFLPSPNWATDNGEFETTDLQTNPNLWECISTPIITLSKDSDNTYFSDVTYPNGIFNMLIYSVSNNTSSAVPYSSTLYNTQEVTGLESQYWYLHTIYPQSYFPSDLLEATLNKSLKSFPSNSKPGSLAIALQPEKPGKFGMIPRGKVPFDTPFTYKLIDSGVNYYSFFPGFYYTTKSGIYIDQLDIKVIDEATGMALPLYYLEGNARVQNGLIYNCKFSKFDPYSRVNSGNLLSYPGASPIFSQDWTYSSRGVEDGIVDKAPFSYFQIKDDNQDVFLLTNQPSITDHTSTTFESSDSVTPKAHTGLFCADLEDNWNRWLRLEVSYYDQFDNKQGTFIQRFNPYQNDVFGTNLRVKDLEPVSSILLDGPDVTRPGFTITPSVETKNFQYRMPIAQKADASGLLTISRQGNSMLQTVFPASHTITWTISESYSDMNSTYWNKNYEYLYTDSFSSDRSLYWSINPSVSLTNGTLKRQNNIVEGDFFKLNGDGLDIKHQYKIHKASNSPSVLVGAQIDDISVGTITFNGNSSSEKDAPPYPALTSPGNDVIKSIVGMSSIKSASGTLLISHFNDDITYKSTHNITGAKSQLRMEFTDNQFKGSDEANAAYGFAYLSNTPSDFSIQVTGDLNISVSSISVASKKISPSFQVIPYFSIKGINDKAEEVYLSKLFCSDPLWYECNFVNDVDGAPFNYCSSSSLSKGETANIANTSFKVPGDREISEGVIETFFASSLPAGVYVFNMATSAQNEPRALYSTDGETALVSVTVDGTSYEVLGPTSTGALYRWAGSTQNYVIEKLIAGGTLGKYHKVENQYGAYEAHYWPIVIVLSQYTTSLSIQFQSLKGKHYYQDAGIYKIRDIDPIVDQTDLLNITENKPFKVMMYGQYQNYIANTKAPDKSLEPVRYYNYVQKYGVFFRQCFSYKEAQWTPYVHDGTKYVDAQVSNIKCYDSEYSNQTVYFPINPYEINFVLDWRSEIGLLPGSAGTAMCVYMPNGAYKASGVPQGAFKTLKYFPTYSDSDGAESICQQISTGVLSSWSWGKVRTLRS